MPIHYCPSRPCPICHPSRVPLMDFYSLPEIITTADATDGSANSDTIRIKVEDLHALMEKNKQLAMQIANHPKELSLLKDDIMHLEIKNKKLAEKLGRIKEILK